MAKYPIRFELPKAKPMPKAPKPAANKPAPAITQRDLDRHARMQGEEARGEALLMKRRNPDIIRTTTNMRTTPPKKAR